MTTSRPNRLPTGLDGEMAHGKEIWLRTLLPLLTKLLHSVELSQQEMNDPSTGGAEEWSW